MKKMIMIAAVGLLFASCKKNYTCVCEVTTKTTNNGNTVTTGPVTRNASLGKVSKAVAQKKCSDMDGPVSSGTAGNGVVVDNICELKK